MTIKEARESIGIVFEGEPKENEVYIRIIYHDSIGLHFAETNRYNSNNHKSTQDVKNENVFFKDINVKKVLGVINAKR